MDSQVRLMMNVMLCLLCKLLFGSLAICFALSSVYVGANPISISTSAEWPNQTYKTEPFKLRAIAHHGTDWYLQTYEIKANNLNKSTVSSKPFDTSNSSILPHPDGYCTSESPDTAHLNCFDFAGRSLGTWNLTSESVVRILAVIKDEAVIWLDKKCVKYKSFENQTDTWTLYCVQMIDPDNIVIDHVNWHLFYRNRFNKDLIHVDLSLAQGGGNSHGFGDSIIANASQFDGGEKSQPMRLALDVSSQVLYYLTPKGLFKTRYDFELPAEERQNNHQLILDLNGRDLIRGQQLKFIEGSLYWISSSLENPDQEVIMKYDQNSTLTTPNYPLVNLTDGFEIIHFYVDVPRTTSTGLNGSSNCSKFHHCSHFCRSGKLSSHCWCPVELPVLKFGQCTQPKTIITDPLPPSDTGTIPTKNVVVGSVTVLGVVLLSFVIGFGVYKKFLKTDKNIAFETFLYGNDHMAESAQDDAERAQYLPFQDSKLLDPQKVKVHRSKKLGEGNFGVVCEGEYNGRRVAVKTLKDNLDFSNLQAFFKELKIMAYVGKHQHIVELIGAEVSSIYSGRVHAVLEFGIHGSLDKYLWKHRSVALPHKTVNGTNDTAGYTQAAIVENPTYVFAISGTTDAETTFSVFKDSELENQRTFVPLLCHWSYQVSRAMSYLTSKRVVHGDLATRNVLVFEDNILKLSDFGLSRNIYQKCMYESRNRNRSVPWQWASPEVLEDLQFSFHSDVWSYGVTLWEIFEFAKKPYANRVWNLDFVKELKNASLRLSKPELMPQQVYDEVVLKCFEADPGDRIDFAGVEKFWVQYFTPVGWR